MKSLFRSKSYSVGGHLLTCLLFCLSSLPFASTARAQDGGDPAIVTYVLPLVELQGIIPFSRSYTFTVKSPATLTPGVSVPVTFAVSPVAIPAGVSAATANSYVSITPANPTFTGPSQVQTFSVVYNVPANAVAGSYGMKILAQGFPVPPEGIINPGTFINAAVAPTGAGFTPPAVSIATPINGSIVSITAGSLPVSVPYSFVATSIVGLSSPITQLEVQLDLVTIPLGASSGVGTTSAAGSGNLTITTLGAHTFTALATNLGGQTSAVSQFTVIVRPEFAPPDVAIATPIDASTITVSPAALPLTIPVQFASTSTITGTSPITAVSATYGVANTPIVLTSTGLNTTSVNSTGSMVITAPGSYTVTANATNLGGAGSDTNGFTVVVQAAPPTVVINSPTVNSSYDYRLGSPATVVPFTFTATSSFGGVQTLTAKVDGANVVFTPSGLGTATATGSINLPYTTAGTHTVSVTTTDNNGTATATSNFTVNLIAPTPTITISQPTAGATFTAPVGSTTVNVPYSFLTTSNNGFFVDSVSATLDGNPIVIGGTTGLGTASATSTGTLTGVTAGSHTLVVTGISAGISVTTSASFTVSSVQPLPTVVINTPAAGSTFTRVSGGAALSIPLTFTGTSNATGGVITQLKATLNGTALTVTSSTLGQKIANGAATMSVTAAGTYTINVTAIDAVGTATASRTFSVVVVQPRNIYGSIFFDVDCDGNYDCEDFDISGITVKLYNAANVLIGTDVTDCGGDYSFCNIAPGTYRVVATAYAGLKAATVSERTVTVAGSNVCTPRIGFCLDFAAIRPMTANGFTIGYWKNNLDKAIACKTSGTQVSKATLESYTCKISSFALSTYDNMSMKTASSIMGYSGSNSSSLLSKQLIASEYNYQSAAYLGGNKTLTMAFLWWGEYVLANPSKYGSTYTLWAKDWFDAYNNTHGGAVNGPL